MVNSALLGLLAAGIASAGLIYTPPGNQNGVEGAVGTFSIGSVSDTVSGPYDYTVNWGDATTTLSSQGSPGSLNHTYSEEGAYTVDVTAEDSALSTDSGNFTITIFDPSVTGASTNISGAAGAALTGISVATFTDPGGDEALADYAATIDWGDATVSAGLISLMSSVFDVQGNHTYAVPGDYSITTTISHDSSRATTVTSSAVVTPEPGPLLLIGSGIGGLLWRRRRVAEKIVVSRRRRCFGVAGVVQLPRARNPKKEIPDASAARYRIAPGAV